MELLQTTSVMVKCPHCGNKFSPEEALGHDIRLQMEKEFEKKLSQHSKLIEDKIKRQEFEKYNTQIRLLEDERKAKLARVKELETAAITLEQREMKLREREDKAEIELKRRQIELEKIIRQRVEKDAMDKAQVEVQAREQQLQREKEMLELTLKKRIQEETEKTREEERMRSAELQKKLDDQTRLILEMKRKSEQGSMQMQGEVQELAIEAYLESTFPKDTIEPISKGKRGGDCVHIVKDTYNHICGKILYESKRTKHFSSEWITKVKDDMRLQQADLYLA